MRDDAEADRIRQMVFDIHWEYQQQINDAFLNKDQDALWVCTALLQHRQVFVYLDESVPRGPQRIRKWDVTEDDLRQAGDRILGFMDTLRVYPDMVQEFKRVLFPPKH